MYLLFIDYLQNVRRKVQAASTVCNTHVIVMHAWVVGRGKHFTKYIVSVPAETPTINAYVVNYLYILARTPTQVTAQEE